MTDSVQTTSIKTLGGFYQLPYGHSANWSQGVSCDSPVSATFLPASALTAVTSAGLGALATVSDFSVGQD